MRTLLIVLLWFFGSVSGSASTISFSSAASRTSGVAPLSVFFDATDTTDTGTKRPFHDLQYKWTFGDPANGATWAYGSNAGNNSKNTASGPVAAHVFETPGTYIVVPSVTDDGVHFYKAQEPIIITVTDPNSVFPGSNTICIAARTQPVPGVGGCPVGALGFQQVSFSTAINTYALTGKRVLFKRGDTFINPTTAILNHAGPGIIGAYGTGANPIITSTLSQAILQLSSKTTPGISDWRIMDLEINGNNAKSNWGISDQGGINQVLLLRMNIHNTHGGVGLSSDGLDYWNNNKYPGHTVHDQITIADTSITTQTGGGGATGVYIEANRFAMLGTLIDDTTQIEHVARFPYLNKAVISNNTLSRPAANKHALKIHAPLWCQTTSGQAYYKPVCNYSTDTMPTTGVNFTNGGVGYSQFVVVSDNKMVGAPGSAITVNLAPYAFGNDNRLRNIIFERNWLTTGNSGSTQDGVNIVGVEMTLRNNICDMTGASGYRICFNVTSTDAASPPADNIRIYNNTGYASDTSSTNMQVSLVSTVPLTANLSVINNLMYFPVAPKFTLVYGTSGTGYLALNNSTSTQIKSTSPLFTISAPMTLSSFRPAKGSYAIGGGAPVPVWSDFYQVAEPATRDIGAIIH